MRVIFFGPQGSGKGTQAKIVSQKLGLAHLSIGDILRNYRGDLKKDIENCMNSGNLVSDELVIEVLKERLKEEDCKKGFILDGFPRNIVQAKELDKITKIDRAIEIKISDEESIKRILSRVSCPKCNAVYNLEKNAPKKENTCDLCGSELKKRSDDNVESIRKRLSIYHSETEPLLKKYKSIRINGEQPIEKVTRDILEYLSK